MLVEGEAGVVLGPLHGGSETGAAPDEHRVDLARAVAVGDRARIAQVIANLLSNAIKYSPDGGDVEVAATRTDGHVQITVSDHGLGIPTAAHPHVFEKFFRVERGAAARIGGTGLGLALAHEIVLAHGGRMGFESAEGRRWDVR